MAGHPSSFPPPLHQRPDKVKKCFVQKYGHNFGSMHTQIENPGTKSVALSPPTLRQGRSRQTFSPHELGRGRLSSISTSLTSSSCSTFAALFPGLTKEEEVLEVLCILDTNTFQVEQQSNIQIDFNAGRFWQRVAPPPSLVSSPELLFSTTAALQTAASSSGLPISLFSYKCAHGSNQVGLLPASDHECGFEERLPASHLLHPALLLPPRATEHPAARETVHLPMPTLQRSTRAGSSTLLSQMSKLCIWLSLSLQSLPPCLNLALQPLLCLPLT